VLLVRTGYIEAYLAGSPEDRVRYSRGREFPGLHAGEEMARYLWDSGVAAVATDNPAVELSPGDPAVGSLHRRLIPLLGFALGEFFDFGRLALDSAADGTYTSLFVAAPLNLPGGVGSPGNALAIK
jgi:kynurenine formamidase